MQHFSRFFSKKYNFFLAENQTLTQIHTKKHRKTLKIGHFSAFFGSKFFEKSRFFVQMCLFSTAVAREFTHNVGNFVDDITCEVGDTFATHRHVILFSYVIDKVAYLVGGAVEELTAIARSADHHDTLSLGWFGIGKVLSIVIIRIKGLIKK